MERQNELIKQQRALLREMKASEDDPRAKALDRMEEKQKFCLHECRVLDSVSHTEDEDNAKH